MGTAAANARWCAAFVDELARCGVRDACVCPGSRSTPLAMALARHRAIKVWMHIDERSASFFALGMAKSQRRAVALLCTSGSAAANFMPAVVEAHYARVPLLVLTADRPHELRDTGAPQTIDQIKLYGGYAKWFVEMALPEAADAALRYARTISCRAVATANAAVPGPVHLNFPFREPFVPEGSDQVGPDAPAAEDEVQPWAQAGGEEPYIAISSGLRAPSPEAVAKLAACIAASARGLIVCGPHDDETFASAIGALGAHLGFPTLADPLSLVRCGSHNRQMVVDSYDAFLRCEEFVRRYSPDLVLRFGSIPTSKALVRYLEGQPPSCRQVFVDGSNRWNDTGLIASDVIHADPTIVCRQLPDALQQRSRPREATAWHESWLRIDQITRRAIVRHLQSLEVPFEGKVFWELAELLPQGAMLYAGNSMPVRDLDTFFPGVERSIRFLANRGANGIDGVLSSALGAAVRAQGPSVLVIGDLSFYHDSNGMLAGLLHRLHATIILLNNNGGGIFSFLPQAAYPEHFEELFGTPHGLDFSRLAAVYGAGFTRIATWNDFRATVRRGMESDGVNIIEVPTDRLSNVRMHREIWQRVAAAIAPALDH